MLKLRCQEKRGDIKPKRQEMFQFMATDDRVTTETVQTGNRQINYLCTLNNLNYVHKILLYFYLLANYFRSPNNKVFVLITQNT